MKNKILRWLGLAAAMIMPLAALSQQTPPIPSTMSPGAVEREAQRPREPVQSSPSAPLVLQADQQQPPANAASLSFTLRSLNVSDAKALSSSELTPPYAALIGQTVTVQKIYQIASEMTVRYRKAGYLLSSVLVPAQTIIEGQVTLHAVEGYVAAVNVEGDVGRRSGLLEAMRQQVLEDKPLHTATLERYLLLLNDLPGVTAQGILTSSKTTPGASDLLVRLHVTTANLTASVNNRGSSLQGPVQLQGGIGVNSIFGTFDNTAFNYLQAAQGSELRYYSGSHSERLTASGLELTLSGGRSTSATALGEELAANNLQTDNTQGRFELSYPLQRGRSANVYVHGAATYSDGETNSLSGVLNHDILFAVRFGFNVDLTDAAGGVNLMDVEFSHGIQGLGASDFGSPEASRPGGRPDFSKVTVNLARLQSLGGPFSLLLALNSQEAFNKVLIAEEFAYGGAYFGRAYDASELVGDSGVAVKGELRYTLDLNDGFGVTVYGFGENGWVWRRITTDTGTPATDSALSAGGGVRFSLSRWASGYVEAAKPINHIIAVLGDQRTRVFAGIQFNVDL